MGFVTVKVQHIKDDRFILDTGEPISIQWSSLYTTFKPQKWYFVMFHEGYIIRVVLMRH